MMILLLQIFCAHANADMVYLKNKRAIEGIIDRESGDSIELDIGFGTITLGMDEISEIKRSTSGDRLALRDRWAKKAKILKEKEKEFIEAREKRLAEYERQIEGEQKKRVEEESSYKELQLLRDVESRSILVEAAINEKEKLTLILDTGSSLVVLSKKAGEILGIDLTDTKKDIVELRMAGDHTVKAKAVLLDSIKIQDVEERGVLAAVLLEDTKDAGFKDGLLGRTFLNRFNINIDLKAMKMTLERLK